MSAHALPYQTEPVGHGQEDEGRLRSQREDRRDSLASNPEPVRKNERSGDVDQQAPSVNNSTMLEDLATPVSQAAARDIEPVPTKNYSRGVDQQIPGVNNPAMLDDLVTPAPQTVALYTGEEDQCMMTTALTSNGEARDVQATNVTEAFRSQRSPSPLFPADLDASTHTLHDAESNSAASRKGWKSRRRVRFTEEPDATGMDSTREASAHGLDINNGTAFDDEIPSGATIDRLKARMLRNGYCPHQVAYLVQVFDSASLREFAALDRRPLRPEDHTSCATEPSCIAYHSPLSKEYRGRHTAQCPGRGCYMIETPQRDLLNIIRSGGVPLISVHEREGHLSLKVHRRGFFTKYATISHVWADGLGNPHQNALPSCQVEQLHSLSHWLKEYKPNESFRGEESGLRSTEQWILRTAETRLIWMDTLCIPVGTEHASLRARCIDQMASIYAGSSPVIVLDKELMATRSATDLENLYRIACSVWMTRSWTLQEAVLPQECVFMFSNEIYQPERPKLPENLPIVSAMFDQFLDIRKYKKPAHTEKEDTRLSARKRTKASIKERWRTAKGWMQRNERSIDLQDFLTTWNGLAARSTTEASDLWVVLASCLDLKHRQFRHIAPNEKMMHVVFSFRTLPFSLFFNPGPRIDSGGNHHNRWVPTQVSPYLLRGVSTFSLPDPKISKYSDQGTRLELDLGFDVTALYIDHALPGLERYVLITDFGAYEVHPVLPESEKFQSANFVATCIIMESQANPNNEHVRRGACFYVASDQGRLAGARTLELVHFCPVVLEASTSEQDFTNCPSFAAQTLQDDCQYWVKFNPIPGSHKMQRQRSTSQYSQILWISALSTLTAMLAIGTVATAVLYYLKYRAYFTDESDGILHRYHEIILWRAITSEKGKPLPPPALKIVNILIGLYVLWWTFLIIYYGVGAPIFGLSAVISYFIVRLRDYVFLYKSYDDKSIADRLGRLVRVVFRAPIAAVRRWTKSLLRVYAKAHAKRRPTERAQLEDWVYSDSAG